MSILKPWETDISGNPVALFPYETDVDAWRESHPHYTYRQLGIVIVALFWTKPEQDYIKAFFDEKTIVAYGQEELATWLAGIALNEERKHILHIANRDQGTFEDEVGWRPLTVIKWRPTLEEEEHWIEYETEQTDAEWSHWNDETSD